MDKKIALINLIENSFLIGDELKKELLEKTEYMTDDEVNKLGKLLILEREAILSDENNFIKQIEKMIKPVVVK